MLGGLRLFVAEERLRVLDHAGKILMSDEEVAEADAAEGELRRLKARYDIVDE